jgi:hypothetical protein
LEFKGLIELAREAGMQTAIRELIENLNGEQEEVLNKFGLLKLCLNVG